MIYYNNKSISILNFWKDNVISKRIENKQQMKEQIKDRFYYDIIKARKGKYDNWINYPLSFLALILLLSIFSKLYYTNTELINNCNEQAIFLLQKGIILDHLSKLDFTEKLFIISPLIFSNKHIYKKYVLKLLKRYFDPNVNIIKKIKKIIYSNVNQINKCNNFIHLFN